MCHGTPNILDQTSCAMRPMRPFRPFRPFRFPWKRPPAIPRAKAIKSWRRIAIRRYDHFTFVPHAHYSIIDSNFCQAPVANPQSPASVGSIPIASGPVPVRDSPTGTGKLGPSCAAARLPTAAFGLQPGQWPGGPGPDGIGMLPSPAEPMI
jgi:hypothetical protein